MATWAHWGVIRAGTADLDRLGNLAPTRDGDIA